MKGQSYVRFGSLADMYSAKSHVRFSSNSGRDVRFRVERRLRENAPMKFWSVKRASEVVRDNGGSFSFGARQSLSGS